MKQVFIALATLAALLLPSTAKADCTGLIDCLFGFSERVETRQAEMTERKRIQAQRDAEVERIQADADVRIREAEEAIERVKQQQYESEAARDIAIAEAENRAEEYKAMIQGLVDERVATINRNANMQIAALQEQAKIAIEGITQTGITQRYRIVGGWAFAGLVVVGVVLIVLSWIRRHRGGVVVLLPRQEGRPPLPWYNEQVVIREVKGHEIVRRHQ